MTNASLHHIRSWAASAASPADTLVFFATALALSMPVSPFAMSLSMWGLVFTTFWYQAREQGSGFKPWQLLLNTFHRLFRQPPLAAFLFLLLVPALSGFWSDNLYYWLERTRVRLPFLILPWVWANCPPLTVRQQRLVLYFFVWATVLLGLGVAINFMLHQELIMDAMRRGQPMPVPRNHIRFSLLAATAVLAGGWLWQERFVLRYRWERPALAVAVCFLFVFQHFLSVRSGLAALYAALFFTAGYLLWRGRQWRVALVLVAAMILVPWTALQTMPSLRQRISYMRHDWSQYINNKGETYSDSERWISLRAGWLIWQTHPWFGTGAGDLPQEAARTAVTHFPNYQKTPKLPHNQWLYILAGTGLFGLILSLLAFLFPICTGQRQMPYLFAAFQVMVFTSFLVEYTIETAMGVAWYLFFTLWFFGVRRFEGSFRP